MFATLDGTTQIEMPEFRFDADATPSARIGGSVKTPSRPLKTSRVEIVETALRTGFPLHRVENYFDWLDMSERRVGCIWVSGERFRT